MTLSYLVLLVLASVATAKPNTAIPGGGDGGNKPGGGGKTTTAAPPPPCGKSIMSLPSEVPTQEIVGGQVAPIGGIPWQVALFHNNGQTCGGSYVLNSKNEVKVITAAHCVRWGAASSYSARFGMHERDVINNTYDLTAHSIVRHPNYAVSTNSFDIAIISFDPNSFDAIATTTYASPICLVSTGYKAGEMAMVSGWGKLSQSGYVSNLLQYVNTPIWDYNYCNTESGYAGKLDSTMLCAAGEGKDSCQGDSGGPLAVYRNKEWQLAGIVSWGYGCAQENNPGVYADVNTLRSWIDAKLQEGY